MDWPTYRKFTERDLKGKKVKALESLHTGQLMVPAGTILTVTGKRRGLALWTDPCESCGMVAKFSQVEPYRVELLE